jgi:glycosyltransferase involved in cell wall biosynthesis
MSLKTNDIILVLPSWYPSKVDAFNGDFIERHVQAIAAFQKQYVIYVVKDEKGVVTNDVAIEENTKEGVSEKIIYYRSLKTGFSLLDKLLSQRKSNWLYKRAIKAFIKKNGKPKLVHVHVAMKAGLMALWVKRKWDIPYILSEHWTGYLKEADLRIENFSSIYKNMLQRIIENTSAITVVSDYLGKAIQEHFPAVKYKVIPNVVDNRIFFVTEKAKNNTLSFIHASNMNYQKNTEAILKAFNLLQSFTTDFTVDMYGPIQLKLQEMVQQLNLSDQVFFHGEVPQIELAKKMQVTDALILYSRFETFGCVIIEANACGIPVIVSDLEVFHELIKEGENGFFAGKDAPGILAEKLQLFIRENKFNKQSIAETTHEYKYNIVGKKFVKLYDNLQRSQ